MNRVLLACVTCLSLSIAGQASALTNDNGIVVFTQADALAGNVTPGDTPGFPVTIAKGGSYRLGSNLIVTTQANGIEVRANEVSIDMAGFTLAGSGAGRNGVTSFNRNMKVQHGTVRGFTLDGIRSVAQFLAVEDMVVTANGRHGVNAEPGAAFASVNGSKVIENTAMGITCASYCPVENNNVSFNQSVGIDFDGSFSMALGNLVAGNFPYGIVFGGTGGAGNNTVVGSISGIVGSYIPMQPNACSPACADPP
jgi:hypothetical protein